MKRSDCCNPSAKRNEDRCIGCPMRTPEEPKETASTPKAAESKAPTTAAEQPAARPGPKKSLWAFLNGDIPSE